MCTKLLINNQQGGNASDGTDSRLYSSNFFAQSLPWLILVTSALSNPRFLHSIKYKGRAPRRAYLQLVSSIDLESVQLKQSMGALLNYLQNNIFNMDDGNRIISQTEASL